MHAKLGWLGRQLQALSKVGPLIFYRSKTKAVIPLWTEAGLRQTFIATVAARRGYAVSNVATRGKKMSVSYFSGIFSELVSNRAAFLRRAPDIPTPCKSALSLPLSLYLRSGARNSLATIAEFYLQQWSCGSEGKVLCQPAALLSVWRTAAVIARRSTPAALATLGGRERNGCPGDHER